MFDAFFVLSRLNLYSIFDILLVALIFYWLLQLIQGTQAVQLLRGVLILVVLAAIAASLFQSLIAFSWLLDKVLPAMLVAIPVVFQPEMRRALDRLGRTGRFFGATYQQSDVEKTVQTVVRATSTMSSLRHGVLIVFEKTTRLGGHAETGVPLNAEVTAELLMSIFYPNTALHDGGVIIYDNRITTAAAVFPLGDNVAVSKHMLGTRHRAALGITQSTDAVAVVVSEETGTISVAYNGELLRNLDEETLQHTLEQLYISKMRRTLSKWQRVRQLMNHFNLISASSKQL